MVNCGDVYFWRQNVIIISEGLHSFGMGLMLSFTSVLNPALLSNNSTDVRATPDEASWLASVLGFAGMIGFCIFPFIMQTFGRKLVPISFNILNIVGFLTFHYANNMSTMFAAKFLQGLTTCGITIASIIVAEYTTPKRRGYCVVIKRTMVATGSLICHVLTFFWTWREIAAFSLAPFVISISIIIFIWPQSPSYLAMKGKYSECEKSYTWIFGNSMKRKHELQKLIEAQEKRRKGRKKNLKQNFFKVLGKLKRLDFLKPFLIVISLIVLIESCGRFYMLTYIVHILVEMTGNNSVAMYCTIVVDVCIVLSLSISGLLIRLMKRRTMIFLFGTLVIAMLYTLSVILFLKSKYNIGFTWTIRILIIAISFVSNLGIYPVAFSIISEIFPLEHKGVSICTTGIIFTGCLGIIVKFVPIVIETVGLEGMFAVSASFAIVSLIVLYFILIETKDKTLQEIEDEIKGIKSGVTLAEGETIAFH